ncbi:hypothetical protein HanIR_Chr14g0697281 [Helianthus annuus]|nr:hypothetical protein HanIR_Chr14g0697281 [Helianthus annuus]
MNFLFLMLAFSCMIFNPCSVVNLRDPLSSLIFSHSTFLWHLNLFYFLFNMGLFVNLRFGFI